MTIEVYYFLNNQKNKIKRNYFLKDFSTEEDILEYIKRDIVYNALANPDNHGRNTSFIKDSTSTRLSPIYDVAPMKFFQSEHITSLTTWNKENRDLKKRINWISTNFKIDLNIITEIV